MNLKKAKFLRKMARKMALERHLQMKEPMIHRKLMVNPAHEKRAKETGSMKGVSAVNHPQSVRGIYRWLKRNFGSV